MKYQRLRLAIEDKVQQLNSGHIDAQFALNEIMREFIKVSSEAHVKRSRAKRDLLTFRRCDKVIPPGWAYVKPGISSRLPIV